MHGDNRIRTGLMVGFAALATAMIAPVETRAATFSFENKLSNNSPVDIGEHITLEVLEVDSDTVSFTLRNAVPAADSEFATVTAIGFGDEVAMLLDDSSINIFDESDGVDFAVDPSPGSGFPGGGTFAFAITASALVDGNVQNGVDNNADDFAGEEFLVIHIDLTSADTFGDLLAALADTTLGVGIHVQRLPNGSDPSGDSQSDTYSLVPAPAALPAGLMLLGVMGLSSRRRA